MIEIYHSETGSGNPVSNPDDWDLLNSVANSEESYVASLDTDETHYFILKRDDVLDRKSVV